MAREKSWVSYLFQVKGVKPSSVQAGPWVNRGSTCGIWLHGMFSRLQAGSPYSKVAGVSGMADFAGGSRGICGKHTESY